MNTHKTLRMGALGTLVAVAVLAGCGRDEPDTTSNTTITPSSPSAPAGSSSSSTVTPGTSGYVGPGSDSSSSSSSTSPSTSGSDTSPSSSSSSSSGSAGGPGMSSSDQPSTSPGTSGYVGGSTSGSASDSGTSGSAGSDTDDMRNRSGSSSGSSSGDTSSGTGGTTGNPVGPNSSLDPADRPFRDVAVTDKADPGAAWREALGVRMIRVADTQGDARKSGSGSAGMGATPTNTDKMSKKDKKFIEKAAAGGMFEVEAARLASEKASDPQIKSFAAKLMDHHQQANQELKQIADARGVMLPTKLPSKEQAMIDKLSKAEGDKFDKEFLKTVGLRDHKEDIRQFENAQNETSDAELKSWIAKTLPTLRTHLAEAQSMSGSGPKMQGYTGSSSSQPSEASPTGSGSSSGSGTTTGSGDDPASQGPTGTGVGGSLGGSGSGGGSAGGSAGGAAGGN